MVDGFPYKEEVGGSNPSVPTKEFACGVVVQLVRTPACHVGGRGFESRRSRHILHRFCLEGTVKGRGLQGDDFRIARHPPGSLGQNREIVCTSILNSPS